jgi:hypothetical protein
MREVVARAKFYSIINLTAVNERRLLMIHEEKVKLNAGNHLVTMLLGLWLIVGVFIDGWAHGHQDSALETFFTPWHAVLYSGYIASASWLVWLIYRNHKRGHVGLRNALPNGYGLGFIGAIIFAVGGVLDALWHILLGIEVGIEALYSPTHLLLFLGGTLIVTSPFRTLWRELGASPHLKELLLALLSMGMGTSITAFFAMNFWTFNSLYPLYNFNEQSQISGIAGILITNAILILPMIWLARRWIMPFGSYTILLSLPMLLMGVLEANFTMTIIGIISGLIADLIYKIWRVKPNIAYKNHTIFTIVPFCLFSLYFLVLQLTTSGILWDPVFWGGSIVLTMLSGLTLSAFAFSSPPKDVVS